jgi:hypothetical protein
VETAPVSARPIAPIPAAQPAQGTPGAPLPDAGSPTALAPLPGAIIAQTPPPPVTQAKPAPPAAKPTPPPPNSIAALINGSDEAAKPASGGAYRLQLSAVRSPDAVAGEWARLKHRFPELAGLKNSSSKVDVAGKGTFYRVEAGPLDQAAAKSTCAHLRAEGLGCIVVQH